jgi:GMP synthase-like glutamine amidotransferase
VEGSWPYVSILTDPTFGGVTASFATAADVIIAVGSADPVGLGRFVRGLADLEQCLDGVTATLMSSTDVAGISSGAPVYFVHSYYAEPADRTVIASKTDYGCSFASSIWRDNIFACQFHPEKSSAIGMSILENYLAIVEGRKTNESVHHLSRD